MVMTAFRGDFGYKREELMIHLTFFRGAVGCAVYKRVRWVCATDAWGARTQRPERLHFR